MANKKKGETTTRVCIAVPRRLKAEMEKLNDAVNWSSVASAAFATRIAQVKSNPEMIDVNGDPGKQTFEERTLAHFQSVLITACRDIPELQQVAVIFDWASELNHGAVPFIIGDETGPLSDKELSNIHGMLEQTTKLAGYLSQLLQHSLRHYGQLCSQMEKKFRELQEKETQRTSPQQSEEAPAGEQTASPPAAAAED